jgi:hypothetical protein
MTFKSKGIDPFKGNKQLPGIVRAGAPGDKSIAPALGDRFCGLVFYFPTMTSKSFLSPGRNLWGNNRFAAPGMGTDQDMNQSIDELADHAALALGEFMMDSPGDLTLASKSNETIVTRPLSPLKDSTTGHKFQESAAGFGQQKLLSQSLGGTLAAMLLPKRSSSIPPRASLSMMVPASFFTLAGWKHASVKALRKKTELTGSLWILISIHRIPRWR